MRQREPEMGESERVEESESERDERKEGEKVREGETNTVELPSTDDQTMSLMTLSEEALVFKFTSIKGNENSIS